MNYPVNYSLCNTNVFDVKIYSNRKNLSFFDLDNISNAVLEDYEKNSYSVKIDKITLEEKVLLDNSNYYPFNLRIQIPVIGESIFVINQAILKIINIRGEEIRFNIGNISMANGEFFTLVDVKSIIGMTKTIDNYSTLDKIKLELYNFQPNDIYLKEINLVSSVVKTKHQDICISPNQTVELLLELSYLENSFIDNVGIILVFEYQNSLYEQIINPYVLFKTSTIHTKPVVQVYEVY